MLNIRKGEAVEIMARYISRDKLIQELSVIQNRPVSSAMKIIRDIPTEEVTPIVRGKWLNVSKSVRDDYLGEVNFAECSVCHSIRVADYFCSCCGADMRKMKESGENNGKTEIQSEQ